ncbi:hypothetical protein CK203_037502 [Vitis vinifera]|uniref:Nodulin homeobox N-terminal domain-containing protein n=1 Tax=Vitis vinifera TaxID=29760 RepID=A0A438HMC2_VITVI|nr:hypothetical protein CK203_037502 [Vitis vinifera]
MERVETGGIAERLVGVMVGFFGIGGLKEETKQLEAQLFSLEGAFSDTLHPLRVAKSCIALQDYFHGQQKWPWALTLKFHGGLGSVQSICMSNNANTTVAFGSVRNVFRWISTDLGVTSRYNEKLSSTLGIDRVVAGYISNTPNSSREASKNWLPLIFFLSLANLGSAIEILGLSNNFSGCSTPAPTVPSTQNGEDVNNNKTFPNAKQGFLSLLCKPEDPFSVKPLGRCLEYACESDSLLVMPNKLLRGHPVSNVGDLSIQASQSLGLLLNQLRSILVLCHQTLLIQGINLPLTYRTAKEPPSETRARNKRKFRSGGHRASVPEMKDAVHAAHEHATTRPLFSHLSAVHCPLPIFLPLIKASKVVKEGEKGRVLRLGNERPRATRVFEEIRFLVTREEIPPDVESDVNGDEVVNSLLPINLLHLCEAESIFYLDEVASYPRSLNLAKSIAPSFPCACNPHAWPSPCTCDQFLFPAMVSSVPGSLHTTRPNPDTPEEDISDSSLPTIRFSIQNVSSKYNLSRCCICCCLMEDSAMAGMSLVTWASSMGEDGALMERRLHPKDGN